MPEIVVDSDKMNPGESAKKVADAIIALYGKAHGN
jgi:hypothetical protein